MGLFKSLTAFPIPPFEAVICFFFYIQALSTGHLHIEGTNLTNIKIGYAVADLE
jgi:hypothetical protein